VIACLGDSSAKVLVALYEEEKTRKASNRTGSLGMISELGDIWLLPASVEAGAKEGNLSINVPLP